VGAYVARRRPVARALPDGDGDGSGDDPDTAPPTDASATGRTREVLSAAARDFALVGSPETVRERVDALREAGVDHVVGYPPAGSTSSCCSGRPRRALPVVLRRTRETREPMSRPDAPADRDALTPAVAVVGGGAVGVTAAADLARGAEVTLYDRSDLGAGSSGRAAGVLYDAYAEDVDAALAARAMERFRAFDRSLPEFTFTPCPYVIAVREGDPDAEAVPAMVDRMRAHDRAVSLVDLETLGEQFPVTTDDLAVAAVAEGAGWCDPASYVAAMGERARVARASPSKPTRPSRSQATAPNYGSGVAER